MKVLSVITLILVTGDCNLRRIWSGTSVSTVTRGNNVAYLWRLNLSRLSVLPYIEKADVARAGADEEVVLQRCRQIIKKAVQ